MDGNEIVVRFIQTLTWEQLPPPVREKARLALLDTLGATLAGMPARVSQISAECAPALWPGDEATILLGGGRASVAGAAFANGNTANAADIDDCGQYTNGHPGAQLFAATLAVSEWLGLSGREMLTALVIGYEVAHRAARIWHVTHEVYQACASWGSVACGAATARLLGLTADQIYHTLGIAEYHAPNVPMMRDIDHPAMVKHGIGWGAMNGILSARLAACGYTGIPSLFGFEQYQDWVSDIGQNYIMVDGVIWKKHSCCAWTHAALYGAEKLVKENAIRLEDIAHIRVEGYHDAVRLGVKLPQTTEEAQFNMAWPLAALLVDGEVGPAQVFEARLADPLIRDLASRVEVVESEELNRLYHAALTGQPGGKFGSVVTIELHDGRQFNSGLVEGEIQYPQRYWDSAGLEGKFRKLARMALDDQRVERLVELIRRFEDVPNVRELVRLVV